MSQYVVIEEQSYNIEGGEELKAATDALEANALESARIYYGDPEGPESYASEYYLHVDGTRRMSAGV